MITTKTIETVHRRYFANYNQSSKYFTTGRYVCIWMENLNYKASLTKPNLDPVLSNYHPVSNLSFLSKLLEKCAMDPLNEHCNLHNILPDYQSAYWNGYSCETAIIRLVNDMLWAMESQNVTAVMALDLSAVFDTVDHKNSPKCSWVQFWIRTNGAELVQLISKSEEL